MKRKYTVIGAQPNIARCVVHLYNSSLHARLVAFNAEVLLYQQGHFDIYPVS